MIRAVEPLNWEGAVVQGKRAADGLFQALQPWKPRQFRIKEFSSVLVEFEVKDGKVTAMIQRNPSGELRLARK